jgi:RpiB/LacA/LacB family sugar-phosphate isomerase
MSDSIIIIPQQPKLIGIAADHGGFELKEILTAKLRGTGHTVVDFGDRTEMPSDDYPDFASGEVQRGIAICGSGVGAAVAANKVDGVRACLIEESWSAHQGVEDDDLNIICLGGLVTGPALAWELIQIFLAAGFSGAERHRRRLSKIVALEQYEAVNQGNSPTPNL